MTLGNVGQAAGDLARDKDLAGAGTLGKFIN
jgi:hypothetical protein